MIHLTKNKKEKPPLEFLKNCFTPEKTLNLELSFSTWLVLTCDKTPEQLISTFQLTGSSNEGESTAQAQSQMCFFLQSPDGT